MSAVERIPILKIGDVLLASIQVDLQDRDVLALQEDLAEKITATGAHGVVLDISAVDIVDSFIGRMFATIASTSRLFDAHTVVVGMRPAVAITLVELGLTLGEVRTALDLEKGLAILAELGERAPR
ncbi:STAS domain-containing protein [Actinokineospora diospyrosa]|uniref:RsbT antagonist protein RsbS n=1 Tax=Actinokineospora diospyrosa TaxID=103728 RepID=A0ABT1INK6_9PSEU|nr:STAS domain-containing protein [Actinokineospora diospyrosa]MCP2274256.1 rsbT antagonist protein RsbS [Actinokineospora diospyrosa]